MLKAPNTLPSDPIELRSTAEVLVALAKSQALEIEKLKRQLAGHKKHRFGSKSESADQLNLELRLEEEETAAASTTPCDLGSGSEAKEKPKRKPLPPTLPRNEEVLTPGESCECGGKLRTLGEDGEALSAIGPRTMDERRAGISPRPVCREPVRPSQDGLQLLRSNRPRSAAFTTD